MVVPPPHQNPPLQFSILRLAIALSVFGIPFAFFAHKGEAGIFLSIVVGSALACLSLIIARRDRHRVVDLFLCTSIGALIGVLIAPTLTNEMHPRTIDTVVIYFGIAGAIAGTVFNGIWNLTTRAN